MAQEIKIISAPIDELYERLKSLVEPKGRTTLNGKPLVITFTQLAPYSDVVDPRTLRRRAVKWNIEILTDLNGKEGVSLQDVVKLGISVEN